MNRNRIWTRILLSAVVALQLFAPVQAGAAGDFEAVAADREAGNIYISGNWGSSLRGSQGRPAALVTVKKNYEGEIVLNNATVDLSGQDYVSVVYVEPGAKATVVLLGENKVIGGNGSAGFTVPEKAALTIWGDGSLNITGGSGGAGVGGNSGMSCGEVVIGDRVEYKENNARITANGGKDAAGIGGGAGGSGGEVTIWTGLIEAKGSGKAQDIGYGAGDKMGKAGYTHHQGGRLVNYDNIGWRPGDSARRQELRVEVQGLHHVEQGAITPYYNYTSVDTVFTTDIPKGRKIWEMGMAYLYLPADISKVRLLVEGVHDNNVDYYYRSELYIDIPENGRIKIDVTAK